MQHTKLGYMEWQTPYTDQDVAEAFVKAAEQYINDIRISSDFSSNDFINIKVTVDGVKRPARDTQ